jgi:hypothetical protein
MRILKTAALAMALAMPSVTMAATDGTLGTTSTGTFDATLTLTAPPASQVQVLGLDNLALPSSVTTGGPIGILGTSTFFCVNRSDAGNVFITVSQSLPQSVQGTTSYALVSSIDSNSDAIFDQVPVAINVIVNGTEDHFQTNGVSNVIQQTASTCNVNTGDVNDAHLLDIRTNDASGIFPGDYSGTFTVLVAPA